MTAAMGLGPHVAEEAGLGPQPGKGQGTMVVPGEVVSGRS